MLRITFSGNQQLQSQAVKKTVTPRLTLLQTHKGLKNAHSTHTNTVILGTMLHTLKNNSFESKDIASDFSLSSFASILEGFRDSNLKADYSFAEAIWATFSFFLFY